MILEENISKLLDKVIHLDAIFGKWIVLLLITIYFYESTNFYKLNKSLNRITPKVLSSKLKHLEEIGLIGRNILIAQPLRVEYYITSKGKEFVESMNNTFNLDIFFPTKN